MKKLLALAAAPTLLVIVVISCSNSSNGNFRADTLQNNFAIEAPQAPDADPQDSVFLKQHIREAKLMYAVEEFSEHSYNGGFSDVVLDSLLSEQDMSFVSAHFIYAPDSSFVIHIVEMQSCGAYCNPVWETWIHFKDSIDLVFKSPEFANVTEIIKMPDGKYLLIETQSTRPAGFYTQTEHNSSLVSFPGHNIVFHPVVCGKGDDKSDRFDKRFSIHQEFTMDEYTDFKLSYDAKTQTLNYAYANDMNICCNVDSAYEWSGTMVYKNGCFNRQKETRRSLK